MPDENRESNTAQAVRLVTILTDLPWIEMLAQVWKFGRKIMRGLSDEGMYEILEYDQNTRPSSRSTREAH